MAGDSGLVRGEGIDGDTVYKGGVSYGVGEAENAKDTKLKINPIIKPRAKRS